MRLTVLVPAFVLLALTATAALARPPLNDGWVRDGWENYSNDEENRAYYRPAASPAGALPRADLILDTDSGSMRAIEEFDCAHDRRRLLSLIAYRLSGMREETQRIGEQSNWVTINPTSHDAHAMARVCGHGPSETAAAGGK